MRHQTIKRGGDSPLFVPFPPRIPHVLRRTLHYGPETSKAKPLNIS